VEEGRHGALLGSLSTAVSTKKIEELAETDRNREKTRDLEDEEALGADADAKQVFQFRETWFAQWSGAYGSFHDISESWIAHLKLSASLYTFIYHCRVGFGSVRSNLGGNVTNKPSWLR
jgi:hypothetical protein